MKNTDTAKSDILWKLDHFVINIDQKYREDVGIVERIRSAGFPYEPKWGKETRGFQVSNLWIGDEYLEMVQVLNPSGGGWVDEWTQRYHAGHRGLICLMLDTQDIDAVYRELAAQNIAITPPEWLEFKWFFGLLTRRMPWRNSYLPFFESVPLQIGFQEMKDEKAREFMSQYMVPNARDAGIGGIQKAVIRGRFTNADFGMLRTVFGGLAEQTEEDSVEILLSSGQSVVLIRAEHYTVELFTESANEKHIEIENVKIFS